MSHSDSVLTCSSLSSECRGKRHKRAVVFSSAYLTPPSWSELCVGCRATPPSQPAFLQKTPRTMNKHYREIHVEQLQTRMLQTFKNHWVEELYVHRLPSRMHTTYIHNRGLIGVQRTIYVASQYGITMSIQHGNIDSYKVLVNYMLQSFQVDRYATEDCSPGNSI